MDEMKNSANHFYFGYNIMGMRKSPCFVGFRSPL